MSKTVKLAVALALTAVTATSALAAPRHRGVHPRAYSAPYYKVYPNLGPPRQWAYTPMAYSVAPRSFSGYYPAYPNLRPLRQWAYMPMAYSVAPSSFSGFYPAYPNLRP